MDPGIMAKVGAVRDHVRSGSGSSIGSNSVIIGTPGCTVTDDTKGGQLVSDSAGFLDGASAEPSGGRGRGQSSVLPASTGSV